MDDLMGTISRIMSDPQQMEQISSLAASLGLSAPAADSAKQDKPPQKEEAPSAPTPIFSGTNDFSALLPLIQKLQGGSDDKYITFLRALQPLLSDARKPKIDTAILLLKLFTFLPYLEESGVLPENNILSRLRGFMKGLFP